VRRLDPVARSVRGLDAGDLALSGRSGGRGRHQGARAAGARGDSRIARLQYSSGLSANFTDPGGGQGSYWLRTDTWNFGEVSIEWTGPPFGAATGLVLLTLEDDGWRVWSVTVGKQGISFAPEDAARTFGRPDR
jgi:hypothetical protein